MQEQRCTTMNHLMVLLCLEKKANMTGMEISTEISVLYTTVVNMIRNMAKADQPLVEKVRSRRKGLFRITGTGRILLENFRSLMAQKTFAMVLHSERELQPSPPD